MLFTVEIKLYKVRKIKANSRKTQNKHTFNILQQSIKPTLCTPSQKNAGLDYLHPPPPNQKKKSLQFPHPI